MEIPPTDFQKEVDYCAAVSIAKFLLQQGFITEKEYNKIKFGFIKTYKPDFKFAGGIPGNSQPSSLDMT